MAWEYPRELLALSKPRAQMSCRDCFQFVFFDATPIDIAALCFRVHNRPLPKRHKPRKPRSVYCAAYRPNFEYYCVGIWSGEKLSMSSRHSERIKKFCPTYKHHCISHRGRSTHHRKHSRRYRAGSEEELRSKSYEDILKELSEIVPCTPECNPNVHPHCTQECKCDYDYPRMQRFCNPPALPMFLNVCRCRLVGSCAVAEMN
ncbi:hypothetical protein ANCCEY_13322 [Ancylostoma ceylanicum]|uniref:Uncharacterized protein n=1 Tax=Ancylostoma ceylanicum TaxID=53326 RepID=A0A0D6LIY4_9BILA|nr:hypothetical protein ANCCEY_13322 [Ancylostoma ceylanicum]